MYLKHVLCQIYANDDISLSSAQIMHYFSIEFLGLAVSCLGLGEAECDYTALAIH